MTTARSPRKLTLQLTPLLDLLLIVIFAQYIEVQETQGTVRKQVATAQQKWAVAVSSLAFSEERLSEVTSQLTQIREELTTRQQQLTSTQQDLELTQHQQQTIANLLVEYFDIPEEIVRRTLTEIRSPAAPTTADVERLTQQFQQLGQEQPGRLIEHLLSYEEIRKRCDVWEIYVAPDNFLTITAGNRTVQMQIPIDIAKEFIQQKFIADFVEHAHTLPDPKNLVVMMLTYDRQSQRWATQGVRDALPQVVLRMNFESHGRVRFDYADLGFRIE